MPAGRDELRLSIPDSGAGLRRLAQVYNQNGPQATTGRLFGGEMMIMHFLMILCGLWFVIEEFLAFEQISF